MALSKAQRTALAVDKLVHMWISDPGIERTGAKNGVTGWWPELGIVLDEVAALRGSTAAPIPASPKLATSAGEEVSA